MENFSFTHLENGPLLAELKAASAQDYATTARLLALIVETDERSLYAPAGYSSMFAYCVGVLRFSEDMAAKRIQVARAARRLPAMFAMLADGRLTLSGASMLAAHVDKPGAEALLAEATHQTNAQIALLIANRFPRVDVPTLITPVTPMSALAPPPPTMGGTVATPLLLSACPDVACEDREQHAVRHVQPSAPAQLARVTPLAPQQFELQVMLSQQAHDDLRHAQDLIGRGRLEARVADVLAKALALYVRQLQKQRFAATPKPRRSRRSNNPRQVSAETKRYIWERDQNRCTFVGDSGHRCEARTHLELDHVLPIARGGTSEPSNLRLRCRTHNQLEAEAVLGAAFMAGRREGARRRRGSVVDSARRGHDPTGASGR